MISGERTNICLSLLEQIFHIWNILRDIIWPIMYLLIKGISLYYIMFWNENKGVTLSVFIPYMQKVQVHSSIIQHTLNHENITLDICNIDYKLWTKSKGPLKVLKLQYLQTMQICINKLQKIFCSQLPNEGTLESYYSATTWEKQPPCGL